jgi:hypothetical protein
MAITYPTTLDAFTNPVASDLLTSPDHATQHANINDAVEALETKVAIGNTVLGTYTAYTPTLLNFTIGNGTVTGSYCRVNNFVHYFGSVTLGSTSSVTGNVSASVPINMHADMSVVRMSQGVCLFVDASAGQTCSGETGYNASVTSVFLGAITTSGSFGVFAAMSATTPFTWTTSDVATWNIYYKAA